MVRIALASWPADYGSPVGDDAMVDTTVVVDTEVEVPAGRWAPRTPQTTPADVAWFVDGVRRMEARAWLSTDDGSTLPGLLASWAAGAVRCDGAATIRRCEVRRGLFSAGAQRHGLQTDVGPFAACAAPSDTDAGLRNALQAAMRAMELTIARDVATAGDLVFLDGPVRGRADGRMVGYVKTQHVAYLPDALIGVLARLAPAQRTPLFVTSSHNWRHWSWYVRLPGDVAHPWEAIVRCETPHDGVTLPAAVALADEVSVTLPRFASRPHRDVRAPQNLYPIGGLEHHLRHRLGDARVVNRHLRRAVRVSVPT